MALPEEPRDTGRDAARARHEVRETHEPPAGVPGKGRIRRPLWQFVSLLVIAAALLAWILWWVV